MNVPSASSTELISDQALAALWASSLSSSLRSPGGGSSFRLTPRELEQVVLDHIDEHIPALQLITSDRRADRAPGSFLQWLSIAVLSPFVSHQLRTGVREALQAIIESTRAPDRDQQTSRNSD